MHYSFIPSSFFWILSTVGRPPMVYATPFASLFIYWSFSISCTWFFLRSWRYIIIYFMATSQNIIYILLISFINRSLTGIRSNRKLPPLLLLFTNFEYMYLTTLSYEYNPPLNSVQLMVSKVLIFHENIELIPFGDWYDLSTGNNHPTKHITLILVGISVINQPDLVEVAKKDWAWGTNTSSLFLRSVQNVWHQ